MKVKELIKQLQEADPESDVILQKDAEGNGFSPLSGADSDAVYVPDSTWSGEVYNTRGTAKDAGMDQEAWDELRSGPRCVVIWPVN